MGEEDHVRPAVQAEGELALWKIAIKPGKPLAFGHVGTGSGRAAFIGLPGNPVSSFVTFLMLVRPFILKAQGDNAQLPSPLSLRADFDWARPDARREFLRARRNPSGGLDLFANQSSGVLTSAAWADGLVEEGLLRAQVNAVAVAPSPGPGLVALRRPVAGGEQRDGRVGQRPQLGVVGLVDVDAVVFAVDGLSMHPRGRRSRQARD